MDSRGKEERGTSESCANKVLEVDSRLPVLVGYEMGQHSDTCL